MSVEVSEETSVSPSGILDNLEQKLYTRGWSRYNWEPAVRRIWEEDEEFQSTVVRHILKTVRHVDDEAMLDVELESAKRDGLFFCPDDDYMETWLGSGSTDLFAGLYGTDGLCRYTQRLVIPIYNFAGEIPGFIGYSNDIIPGITEDTFIKYTYPPKDTLIKGRFMYITADEYLKAVREEYICVVDGIFDKRRLTDYGFNSVSLMGSALTFWHKLYLSKIKNIIVIRDSDEAGYKLLKTCKYAFPNVTEIVQGDEWDIDDFLKSPDNLKAFSKVFEEVRKQGFLLSASIRRPIPSRAENLLSVKKRRARELEERELEERESERQDNDQPGQDLSKQLDDSADIINALTLAVDVQGVE